MEKIIIYCDGACSNNQNKNNLGGWGAVLQFGEYVREIHGGEKNTSNNKMELKACIKALAIIKRPDLAVEVYTDSAYLCNCMNQKWYLKWKKNGWKNSKKQPVENQELWIELLDLIKKFENLTFIKVKGHAGIELNEKADELARKGIGELE